MTNKSPGIISRGGKSTLTICVRKVTSFRLRFTMSELRVLGNFALIVGQFILLFKSRQIGLLTLLLGSSLSLPYFLNQKQWDVVAVIVMGITLNLTGLFINPFHS